MVIYWVVAKKKKVKGRDGEIAVMSAGNRRP